MKNSQLLVGFAASLLLVGCGSNTAGNLMERQIEAETGKNADVDMNADGSMEVTTENGKVTVGKNEKPENWPSDVSMYAGATVQMSGAAAETDGNNGMMIVLNTTDDINTVKDFYIKDLALQGWKVAGSAQMGSAHVIAATKGDRGLSLQISDIGNGTTSITLATGK